MTIWTGGFFNSIKVCVYGAVSLLIAGLVAAVKILSGQKRAAREESERLKRRAKETQKRREQEAAVHNAEAESKRKAKEYAEKEADRIASGDRPDTWGDDRLRDKD